MWTFASAAVLGLVLATQTIDMRACKSDDAPGATTSSGDVVTAGDGVRFRVETVVSNLEIPWSMAFAPDNRLFVTERPGRVRIVSLSNSTSEIALTLSGLFTDGEAGLLGIALDPAFAQNRFVYLYYTVLVGTSAINRIARYREVGGRLGEAAVLLDGIPGATIHDGGRIKFGPDGMLYATAGDANHTGLPQDVASLGGKILRITSAGTTAPGNRFNSPVYTFGHRNPQGIDWHPATGALWSSEHGPTGNDEINLIQPGANYGWPDIQGAQTAPGTEAPAAFYSSAIAPSGAAFYRGSRFPLFTNHLFVATLRGTHLLRLAIEGSRILAQERLLEGVYGRLRDVAAGPDGYLYFCTNNRDGRGTPMAGDDRILRIVPAQ